MVYLFTISISTPSNGDAYKYIQSNNVMQCIVKEHWFYFVKYTVVGMYVCIRITEGKKSIRLLKVAQLNSTVSFDLLFLPTYIPIFVNIFRSIICRTFF